MNCENCKWWEKANSSFGYHGWCQRYPPMMTIGQVGALRPHKWQDEYAPWATGIFPLLKPDDCCGEFEAKTLPTNCENCKWWDIDNPEYKSCRRDPPAFIPNRTAQVWGVDEAVGWWPVTNAVDWCGEFEAKTES